MRKRGVEWTINGGKREGIPYYIIYIEDPPRPVRASQWGLLPSKDTKVYSILSLKDLFALRGRERGGEGNYKHKTIWMAFAPTEDEGVTILRTRV